MHLGVIGNSDIFPAFRLMRADPTSNTWQDAFSSLIPSLSKGWRKLPEGLGLMSDRTKLPRGARKAPARKFPSWARRESKTRSKGSSGCSILKAAPLSMRPMIADSPEFSHSLQGAAFANYLWISLSLLVLLLDEFGTHVNEAPERLGSIAKQGSSSRAIAARRRDSQLSLAAPNCS